MHGRQMASPPSLIHTNQACHDTCSSAYTHPSLITLALTCTLWMLNKCCICNGNTHITFPLGRGDRTQGDKSVRPLSGLYFTSPSIWFQLRLIGEAVMLEPGPRSVSRSPRQRCISLGYLSSHLLVPHGDIGCNDGAMAASRSTVPR